MQKIGDCFKLCDDLIILHGITIGAESKLPIGTKFIDQFKYSIEKSRTHKLSTFSFVFHKHNLNNLWGNCGIIIKDGLILGQYKEDSGITCETLHLIDIIKKDEISDVLFSNRKEHNEIILKDVGFCGIWVIDKWVNEKCRYEEIRFAQLSLALPVYFLNVNGFVMSKWDENIKKYKPAGKKFLKFKDIANLK